MTKRPMTNYERLKTCAKNGICDRQIDVETDWMMFPGHGVCGGYEPVVPDA